MKAYFSTLTGEILSIASGPGLVSNDADYGYIDYAHDRADMLKYKVVNGAVVLKSQSDIDAVENDFAVIKFRRRRDSLLAASDWTQANDSPLSDAQKAAWRTYRQALRDLPENTDPLTPTFPTAP
jgi:hypothetical protein